MIQQESIVPFDHRYLDQLNRLPPDDWNANAYDLFMNYEGQSWFKPYQLVLDGRLVAFGLIWLSGDTAWLGWILVDKEFRQQGIGTTMTRFLTEQAIVQGAVKVILTATAMGFPIYRKLGFEQSGYYRFFRNERVKKYRYDTSAIRNMTQDDFEQVAAIDRLATGETRTALLSAFLPETLVYVSSEGLVEGFFIEKLGIGYIAAASREAGRNLLLLHLRKARLVVLPEDNTQAINWLLEKGYTETHRVPRMVLNGLEAPWNPEMIYSRGAGYCG